jgi:catechol 2,3-dioxygenase-like lactoylglutathione lyase family enzyme
MARVVGIDHLVIRVADYARSRDFYDKLLGFLGFKRKYEFGDTAGWSNGKTLFWIGEADAEGKKHPHRIGNIGFHHYAFELGSRKDVDDLYKLLKKHGMQVVDPPTNYPEYGDGYYAVFFLDPDGLKLEGMVFKPASRKRPRTPKRKLQPVKKRQVGAAKRQPVR